jgi:hypothetical protein
LNALELKRLGFLESIEFEPIKFSSEVIEPTLYPLPDPFFLTGGAAKFSWATIGLIALQLFT